MPFLARRFFSAWCMLALVAVAVAQAPRPGYVTGRALTTAGAALPGVRIRVFGTTDAGQRSALDVRTQADGTYRLRLPAGHYSVRSANWTVKRAGRIYSLPLYLEGENNDDFDTTDGAVANFTLKMSGKTSAAKPDDDELAWFGGTIELDYVTSDGGVAIALPAGYQLKLDLTPQGPRFDGSPAQPQTYTRMVASPHANRFILDVPLATYVARATLVTAAGSAPALIGDAKASAGTDSPPFAATATVVFPPRSGDAPLLTYGGVDKFVLRVVIPATDIGAMAPPPVTGNDNNPPPIADPNGAAAPWKVGDHANVLRSPALGQWHAGTIIQSKNGQYLINFDDFGSEQNEWVDASRLKRFDADDAAIDTATAIERTRHVTASTNAPWKVGDAVNVLRSPIFGQWHTGKIIAIKRDHFLIQFDDFGPEQNEWVDASRLKAK